MTSRNAALTSRVVRLDRYHNAQVRTDVDDIVVDIEPRYLKTDSSALEGSGYLFRVDNWNSRILVTERFTP